MELLNYDGLSEYKSKYDEQLSGIVADVYDNTSTYSIGDYCIHYAHEDNKLYKCIVDIVEAEEWNATHWIEVTTTGELEDIQDALDDIEGKSDKVYGPANVVTFDSNAEGVPFKKIEAIFNPVQNLHGYDHPWPGGGSINLFDPSRALNGKRLDNEGNVINYSSYCVSDWIPCEPNTNYYANYVIPSANGYSFCFYDANKHFLRYAVESGGGSTIKNSGANAAYLRVTLRLSDKNTVGIVAKSNSAVSYKPYANICPITGWTGAILGNTVPAPESDITFPFKPKQAAGTPSPENPLPISGYDLTLEDETHVTVYGGTVTLNEDRSADLVSNMYKFTADGSTYKCDIKGYNSDSGLYYYRIKPLPQTAQAPYVFDCSSMFKSTRGVPKNNAFYTNVVYNCIYCWRSENITVAQFNEELAASPVEFCIKSATNRTYHFSDIGKLQTFLGEIGYTTQLLPIKWQTEAGTVYGGTVTLNDDGSADVISTYCVYDISSTQWTYSSGANVWYITRASLSPRWDISGNTKDNVKRDIVCSAYKTETYNNAVYPSYAPCIAERRYNANWLAVQTGSADVRPVDCQVKMKLATPQTYHFSSIGQLKTFLGTNNVWTSLNGTTTVTLGSYLETITNYVKSIPNVTKSSIAPTETSYTATSNYSINDIFFVNDTLYRATAQIASGGTITPDTNCVKTSIDSELTSLLN